MYFKVLISGGSRIFPRGMRQLPKVLLFFISTIRGPNIRFCQIFPKTAWNWKNLDPEGARVPRAHLLDPPLNRYFLTNNFDMWDVCCRKMLSTNQHVSAQNLHRRPSVLRRYPVYMFMIFVFLWFWTRAGVVMTRCDSLTWNRFNPNLALLQQDTVWWQQRYLLKNNWYFSTSKILTGHGVHQSL